MFYSLFISPEGLVTKTAYYNYDDAETVDFQVKTVVTQPLANRLRQLTTTCDNCLPATIFWIILN